MMRKKQGECFLCKNPGELVEWTVQFRSYRDKKKWVCVECALNESKYTNVCSFCGEIFVIDKPRDFCYFCDSGLKRQEMWRVKAQNARADALGFQADLTLKEWIDILLKYKCKCVYCKTMEFAEMDHIQPVAKGGGTTRTNVVPSCHDCNRAKWTTF